MNTVSVMRTTLDTNRFNMAAFTDFCKESQLAVTRDSLQTDTNIFFNAVRNGQTVEVAGSGHVLSTEQTEDMLEQLIVMGVKDMLGDL